MPSGRALRPDGREHYWYDLPEPSVIAVLESVRRHRAAEAAMRRRVRDDMDMGDTDLAALRWIIEQERAGRPPTSAGLSRVLGITTAATVKVVSRLIAVGYVARRSHPSDRRSLLLRTLPGAHERLRQALGPMHSRMLRLAESLQPDERDVVIRFLDQLAVILDETPDERETSS
jgi:DNA-binding MarR family transcriptional regulator